MPEATETNWPAASVRRPEFTPRAGGGQPHPRPDPDVVPVLHLLRGTLIQSLKDYPNLDSPSAVHEAFRLLDRMGLAPSDAGKEERPPFDLSPAGETAAHGRQIVALESAVEDLRGELKKARAAAEHEDEGVLARQIENRDRLNDVEQSVGEIKAYLQTRESAGPSGEIDGIKTRLAAAEKLLRCPTSNGNFVESAVKQLDDRLKAVEKVFEILQKRVDRLEPDKKEEA